jgi:hypothetical protein
MRAKTKARDKAFWSHRLRETVNWIDIYARYDPVPQGPAPKGLVTAIMGKAPRPYVSIRVANHDWPLTDHGAYWDNREEAMSRIVHAVTDSRLGQRPLHELGGSYAQLSAEDGTPHPHALAAAVERATKEAGARRTRVTTHRLGSFLLVAVGALLVFGWGRSLGAWVLAEPQSPVRLPWPPVAWRHTLGDLVPSQIGPVAFGEWRSWIAGVMVLAILIYSVAILGRLVAHWWEWRQREPSDLVVPTTPPIRRRPPVEQSDV